VTAVPSRLRRTKLYEFIRELEREDTQYRHPLWWSWFYRVKAQLSIRLTFGCWSTRGLDNSRTANLRTTESRSGTHPLLLHSTHEPGVTVVRQFIVLPYWRHHLLLLTITYTLPILPYEIPNQPYPGLLFPNHTLSYPTPAHTLPYLYYTYPYSTLLYPSLHTRHYPTLLYHTYTVHFTPYIL